LITTITRDFYGY